MRIWSGFRAAVVLAAWVTGAVAEEASCASPVALDLDAEGRLYVAEAGASAVAVVDVASGAVRSTVSLDGPPSGLAVRDGALYVTLGEPEGRVCLIDTATGAISATIPVGHTPMAPVLSPDATTLYVCNRFDDTVSVIYLAQRKETARVPVLREPVAAAVTPEGSRLFVANLLPAGSAGGQYMAAAVSVIDRASPQSAANIALPNGSSGVRGICVSPDGKYAYAVHILARYQLPTTQLERGWMNTNALTVIDAAQNKPVATVLLDEPELGAANPWGVACSADGALLVVAHAGTHELSVIDRAALHAKLDAPERPEDVSTDLSFLSGIRRRVKLPGNGPRALVLSGHTACVAEYFSDSLGIVDLDSTAASASRAVALNSPPGMTPARRGEMLFNDASLCFQQWQSCASCHPDARVDGFNWDLLNDGIGNPKSTKNMLLTHQTPPVMSLGVRERAEAAVRAGIRVIQFCVRPEEDAVAIDEYLKSMKPVPSPRLVDGRLSPAAERGAELFQSAGCAQCHPAPLYTDLQTYNVGTSSGLDADKPVDTPALVEVWRTAPYLIDGRAATIREVLRQHNPDDRHGATSNLTEEQLNDLAEFVLSL